MAVSAGLSRYHANGVRGVGMWGDWQGSSIWPDCQPGYLVLGQGRDCTRNPVSWRIPQDRRYSTIDAFPRTPGEAGTAAVAAVPWRAGDATLFLGAQLAFDPTQNVSMLAREYGEQVFGEANADAVGQRPTANCIIIDHFSAFEPGLVALFLYAA